MGRVLVLGSSGQIGAPLSDHLRDSGHVVTDFDLTMGSEYDLRTPANPHLRRHLDRSDYVFFLAFDVGGAPYLSEHGRSFEFIRGNTALMSSTFEALRAWGGPFAFASSQMSRLPHVPYGALKAVGEQYTQALGGTVVRLWNVYGVEPDRRRSHVITDFAHMALTHGVISMRTDGAERRDFLHTEDCARGLERVMELHPALGPVDPVCLASGTWTSIREIAQIVADLFDARIEPGSNEDLFAESTSFPPRIGDLAGWRPQISLPEGVRDVVDRIALLSNTATASR